MKMVKSIWRAFKRLVRIIRKCIKWAFLLSLPLTALPILCGILNGSYFAFWQSDRIDTNVDIWIHELKDLVDDWGIPGNTFRDFQDKTNDFHVLRLNSNDWASKLGFLQPLEYQYDETSSTPINKYGDLDTLMLNISPECGTPPPKEQWVYISDYAWPMLSEWDTAFENAVQAAHVPSTLNESRLFFVKCQDTGGFLCGVWSVRTPTLLHFAIEDSAPDPEDIEVGILYSAPLSNLRPVTVRVIEFPLQDSYTGLPPSVFPGPTQQMLAVMRGNKLYEQFEPWGEFGQSANLFQEHLSDHLYKRKGTFFYYLGNTDDWIAKHLAKPLGLDDAAQGVYWISCLVSYGVANVIATTPWRWVKGSLLEFLGYPKKGEWVLGDGSESEDEWNPWNDFMDIPNIFSGLAEDALKNAKMETGRTDDQFTTTSKLQESPSAEPSAIRDFGW